MTTITTMRIAAALQHRRRYNKTNSTIVYKPCFVKSSTTLAMTICNSTTSTKSHFSRSQHHHHDLIRDDAGKRLAKRDDARAISTYRDAGTTPDTIRKMVGL